MLIDTGSPSTIHRNNSLQFMGKTYRTQSEYLGLTLPKLCGLLRKEVSTLIGMDILSEYKISIDYKNRKIVFFNEKVEYDASSLLIENFMGIPVLPIEIQGEPIKCFLDSGARLSYLNSDLTGNMQFAGREKDFYPGIGNFETDCFLANTSIGKESFEVKYGTLPDLLNLTLLMAKVHGILGFDFFRTFKILLDFENNKIFYSKYENT